MKKINIPSLTFAAKWFEKIEKLTRVQRLLICVGVVALLVGPMVYFVFMPKYEEIKKLTAEYQTLTDQLNTLKLKAREINKYRAEMKEVEARFEIAKKALPENEEIPSLLKSISDSGQESGLEFILFKPERDKEMGFYAEIPVSITVQGRYHSTTNFFDKVSILSRIVNIKDIRMAVVKSNQKNPESGTNLQVSCTAVTYKFIEQAAEEGQKSGK
jgi:type IV pilus assembly protein PilO